MNRLAREIRNRAMARRCVDVEIFKASAKWDSTVIRATPEGLFIKVLPRSVVDLMDDDQKRDYPMALQGTYILRFPCSARELIDLRKSAAGKAFVPVLKLDVLMDEIDMDMKFDPNAPPIEANTAAVATARLPTS